LLAIGHAYERAAGWFERHPDLVPHAKAAPIDDGAETAVAIDLDSAVRSQVDAAVRHAGLELDPTALSLLHESAPYAMAMARRLPRDIAWTDEQAAVFTLDP
jgi:hypothetical protein